MKDILIKVENISMDYLGQNLFHNLSFELKKGEKLAIKGPSGCGKSTILNMLCGFERPTAGNIFIYGQNVVSQSDIGRKYCSWLPQDLNFADDDKVEDIILFPFSFKANKQKQIDLKMIQEQFDLLGLKKELLSNRYIDLSGGEKQRVGILICKLLDSEIMLLDEPTSALDRSSVDKVIDYLLRDHHLTIVSVSHDERWCRECSKIVEII